MNCNNIIRNLKWLIQEYDEAVNKLDDMITNWNDYDDPGSDPGLQYEQENKIKDIYNKIENFDFEHNNATKKTVIVSTGFFSLSEKGTRWLADRGHKIAIEKVKDNIKDKKKAKQSKEPFYWHDDGVSEIDINGYNREDPLLIEMIETLGEEASLDYYGKIKFKIIEIPANIKYYIYASDCGSEIIHEEHRHWF